MSGDPETEEGAEAEEPPGYPNLPGVDLAELRRAWLLAWLWELGPGRHGGGNGAKTVIEEAEAYERFLLGGGPTGPTRIPPLHIVKAAKGAKHDDG